MLVCSTVDMDLNRVEWGVIEELLYHKEYRLPNGYGLKSSRMRRGRGALIPLRVHVAE